MKNHQLKLLSPMNENNEIAVKTLKAMGYEIKNIRLAMAKLIGLTHADLGQMVGLKQVTVSQVLAGFRRTPEVQEAIANALGIRKGIFFENEDRDNQHSN